MDRGKFFENKHVRAVVTQGREDSDQWVTSYQVMFKKDDQDNFTTVKDENNLPKVSIVTSVYGRYKILFWLMYLIPVLWVLTRRLKCV